MDDAEFRKKLSMVADWEIPTTVTDIRKNPSSRARSKPEPEAQPEPEKDLRGENNDDIGIDEETDNEVEAFAEWEGRNPTYPIHLLRIKPKSCVCPDCARICDEGRQTEAKLFKKDHQKVWRRKCLTCKLFQNPYTGKYTLSGGHATNKWNDYLSKKNKK